MNDPELAILGGVSMGRQIQTQIRDCIVSEDLLPGEQLPTVRAMAVELAVNPAVVSRAYVELEREGLVTSEEDSGVFVTALPVARSDRAEYRDEFERLCHEFLVQAARYGYSSADVITALEALNQRRLIHDSRGP
jgi:GntR family transcriptional regulator